MSLSRDEVRSARSAVAVAAGVAAMAAMAALGSPAARACGVSTADGVSACSLQEHEEATRPRWLVGASAITTSTAIQFSGDLRAGETRSAVAASLAYQPTRRWTLQAAAGGVFGGRLSTPTGNYDFSPGATAAVGASWRAVEGSRPFVVLTSTLSGSFARTQLEGAGPSTGYQAFDLRLGGLVGTSIAEVLKPYAVARVFGGPVFWRYQGAAVTGGDTHHYQLGAGLTVVIARRASLFAEGIPLGERSLAGGAALAF
jgi:hypothetical protein